MENLTTKTSFTETLKTATATAHTALEALPVSVSVMNPNITKDEYINYLLLMRDVIKDSETNIFPILTGIIPDLRDRNKSHLIDADLKQLGVELQPAKSPVSKGVNKITIPFAMGIFYVIEGSSLGGRVILKNINKALGYDENNGATYFGGYGNLTGPRWKQFIELLSQFEEKTNTGTEISEGATYAFKAIHKHFSQLS